MTHPNLDLGALIGARICHDLISPVGAIANGLELLSLSGAPDGPEMSLVSQSALSANARIRFFRIAFGLSADGQSVSSGEMTSVLGDVYCEKCSVDWQIDGPLPRRVAQAVFLALLCAEQAVPFGGVLTVSGSADAIRVEATGTRVAARPEHWAILDTPEVLRGVPATQVQFAMLPVVVSGLGRRMNYTLSDQLACIVF